MADVDLPEAKNPFEKGVALTIAIIAVVLSFVENQGDNAKTDAIVKTNEAANQWAYYQSKSLKGNLAESSLTLLSVLAPIDAAAAKAKQEEMSKEVARYEEEKKGIKTEAEGLQQEAAHSLTINDRCDQGSLLLQISVVLCSIAILVGMRPVFYAGGLLGLMGAVIGGSSFFI
ncbi:MAG: hypothetical protein JWO89_992 [Verrucomicrobiaceae bacterium]|nr:hypothetical protein [Verrucomicrobiaceae bacterium]